MDATLKTICGLLQSPDTMRRSAAAITLAALAPKDKAVVPALGAALGEASGPLAGYLLEALEAIGSPAAVPFVMPLLDAEDVAVKLRAAGIIAKAGGGVVKDIRARLAQASPAQVFVLVDLLARIPTREAFGILLELLGDPNFDLVKAVCEAVHRHAGSAAPKERALMHKEVALFMNGPRAKGSERILTSCLLLLGYIGRPEARAALLKHTAAKCPAYVRKHALIGLGNLELTGAAAAAVARQAFACLADGDDAVVRHAVDLLARLASVAPAVTPWRKLLGHPNASVRAFAVRKIAAEDTPAANRELVGLLRGDDTDLREVAAGALASHPGATALLVDALTGETDADAAWRLAKILKPHASALDEKTVKRLTALAAKDMQQGKPLYEALVYVLRNADPRAADAVLRATGLEHQRAKRWAQAVECLRKLIHSESFDDEARYVLSLCNLKVSGKDLAPHMRADDHALRGFAALVHHPTFRLLERVKKDKSLAAPDLYYMAFHFSEGTGADRAFGDDLLAHIAKTWPKTEEGRAAKNKLKITRPGGA